jgi:hypothetical protein
MPNGDFIPGSDKELNEWAKFLAQPASQRTAGSPPAWTHVPAPAAERFSDTYAGWYTPYTITLKPRTPLDTLAKNMARDILKKEARSFANGYIRYPSNVSAEDRAGLGIFDAKPSPVPGPVSEPEAGLAFPGLHLVEPVHIRKTGALRDGPRSDYGVRIYCGVADAVNSKWRVSAPPAAGEGLPHSVFSRRKKMLFDFGGESGKAVYFCLRYEKQSGGETGAGPFGPILHAVIP